MSATTTTTKIMETYESQTKECNKDILFNDKFSSLSRVERLLNLMRTRLIHATMKFLQQKKYETSTATLNVHMNWEQRVNYISIQSERIIIMPPLKANEEKKKNEKERKENKSKGDQFTSRSVYMSQPYGSGYGRTLDVTATHTFCTSI